MVDAVQIAAAMLPANGTQAYVVRACNPTGACNASASESITVVHPPRAGAVTLVPSANASVGYFSEPSVFEGLWHGIEPGSTVPHVHDGRAA